MINKSNTQIRNEAKKAFANGKHEEAAHILNNGIKEEEQTFGDKLALQEYFGLSKAWLQAECVAEQAFKKINTPEQEREFRAQQERLDPPELPELIRGKQFGSRGRPAQKILPLATPEV